jgi:Xaa-Pro aminopeptidase
MKFNRADILEEFTLKITRIQGLLDHRGLDGLLLRRVSSFAWITCGATSFVVSASTEGVASLLITPKKRYLITNNIEAPRLVAEEALDGQEWEIIASPWFTNDDHIEKLTKGMKFGADGFYPGMIDLTEDIAWLRSQLTPQEGQRFRILGNLCAQGMQEAINSVTPGMTEFQIAAVLAQAVESEGVKAIGNMVATDERINKFRHPLPTSKSLSQYAMLILCGRRWGLVCSLTRLIHFGKPPDDLQQKAEAVAYIDAAMISATRPGNTMGDVFRTAQNAYAKTGFANEWQNHHQGGCVGYEPREITATPASDKPILCGQIYAWNPSISGSKSEDSFLVSERENEILTTISGWPTLDIQIGNQLIKRPAILFKD